MARDTLPRALILCRHAPTEKTRAARSTFHSNETLAEAMCQRSAIEIQKWKQKRFKNSELILVISHVCKIQPITSDLGFSSVAS